MNIIICGAGKVGFSIIKQLYAQGHSVTVIDKSSQDIKKIKPRRITKIKYTFIKCVIKCIVNNNIIIYIF